ncbi:kinase domain-containing protein [Paracoccidioides lutzii Pb01]|uniref:Kinase domain-containing protein n=1 Tax=Paracoccidioides lutzii (strain ATCC MYA-826 / Pb01) TaxID=502779 RepID=C1HC81_PARBA|nr:kinase domain-containing protein [Paracoccidioides lutzii Pb01]EEH38645.1 kinase domain-containing protein [Paracoccidioides lutzii Pb01]
MSKREPPISLALKTSVDPNATYLCPLSLSSALTPPLTPTTPHVKPTLYDDHNGLRQSIPVPTESDFRELEGEQPENKNLLPLEFPYDIELQSDSRGRPIEYGSGAWSVVYKATSRWIFTTPDCPPTPPRTDTLSLPPTSVIAVKSPVRRDAHLILLAEARLLSRLSQIPGAEHHIVPFHGFISLSHSLVLSAIPLSLSDYISNQAVSAQETFSTKTMFYPVLGMPRWLALARELVIGLDWLHSYGQIVHGDIKPQNVLLKPREPGGDNDSAYSNSTEDPFPYEPIYIDFTSSYDPLTMEPNSQSPGSSQSLSALTPPFAAPELLTVQSLKSTNAVQSKGSDVFSLAVTLLTAVTGDLMLYPGSTNMQRLAMSRDGHWVLDYVRSGVHGSRLPVRGIAEKILSPAVVKDPESRIKTADWRPMIEDVIAAQGLQK